MTEFDEVKSENASLRGAAQGLGELCDKYKTENAELRKMLSESRQTNERLYDELKRYKRIFRTRPIAMNALFDENDKLRELAKAAWGCVNRRVSCDACRMTCGGCTLQSTMRELGIEVGNDH
jgi:hypothetical protein